jgi:hypothetical protein
MTDWVNAYTDLPLDVDSGAAAAYSLRNLKASYTGNVVEVRRSSDDDTRSFTASEVADGTLESWVGAGNDGFVKTWYDQSGNINDAAQTDSTKQPKIVDGGTYLGDVHFDGSDDYLSSSDIGAYQSSDGVGFFCAYSKDTASTSDAFSSTNPQYLLQLRESVLADSTFAARVLGGKLNVIRANETASGILATTSNAHTIGTSLVLSSVTGTQAIDLFEDGSELSLQTDDSGLSYDSATTNLIIGSQDTGTRFLDGGIKEMIIYKTDQSNNRVAIEANIGDYYGIDLPAGVDSGNNKVDGFVTKWYDQSGNGNDAVQATAAKQPKIVDAGTYLGELEFDGTSELASSSSVNIAQLSTAFSVVRPENLGANKYIWTIGGTSGIISYIDSAERAALAAGSPLINGTLSTVDNSLKFDFCNTTSSIVAINGSSGTSGTIGTRSGNDVIRIGGRGGADFMYGSISELIIYNSDQSDNRTAIETNIADEYGITLS